MNSKRLLILSLGTVVTLFALAALPYIFLEPVPLDAVSAAPINLPWKYEFRVDGTLEESASSDLSSSPYFWLNSGGLMPIKGGMGGTYAGDLPTTSRWYRLYNSSNPVDTDNGRHPQNLFRLFTRQATSDNYRQEAYFLIDKYNVSSSPNRSESNGILLFNRTVDNDNLYYAGIRVDGNAVIKKKIRGTYYTMAIKPAFGGGPYNRTTNPNLLPLNNWIGIRTDVENQLGGLVKITLYTDVCRTGTWTKAAEAIDNGITFGGAAFTGAGRTGIRTDFMDVRFDDYALSSLPGGLLTSTAEAN